MSDKTVNDCAAFQCLIKLQTHGSVTETEFGTVMQTDSSYFD